jgi:hypothetical protein
MVRVTIALLSPLTPLKNKEGDSGDGSDGIFPNLTDEAGVSRRRIQELADWYTDETYRRDHEGRHDTAELDAELRAILREEVAFPDHVEIEFERVTQILFKSRGPSDAT